MSRASERAAAARAQEILKAAHSRGEEVGGDYGSGRLTKAQKKSQEKHIPWTTAPQTAKGKIWRNLVG